MRDIKTKRIAQGVIGKILDQNSDINHLEEFDSRELTLDIENKQIIAHNNSLATRPSVKDYNSLIFDDFLSIAS